MVSSAVLQRIEGKVGGTSRLSSAVVLVDGCVEETLSVLSVEIKGPLDVREAKFVWRRDGAGFDRIERSRHEAMIGKGVTVIQPIGLVGGVSELMVVFDGRIVSHDGRLSGREDEMVLNGQCYWSEVLSGVVDRGELEEEGVAWSVGSLLERLNRIGGLKLKAGLVGADVLAREVSFHGDNGVRYGTVLQSIFKEQRLVIRRTLRWEGHGVNERRTVQVLERGRNIRMRLENLVNGAGVVEALRSHGKAGRPVKLIGEASGQLVEGTFELVAGWDDSDAGLADGEYGKSTSSDFTAVSNTFRMWVLNEDGVFSPAPFNRGTAFDLTEFFEEGSAIKPRSLKFLSALSMDEAGRRLGVVVEVSLNGGINWARYGGRVRVIEDRAGIYLDDDVLDAGFIAAAKAGSVRVRVTGSLRSPHRLRIVRWRGNPFLGSYQERIIGVGDRFKFQRVESSSQYYSEVLSGTRDAAALDERDAFAAWLDAVSIRERSVASVEVVTAGRELGMRIGDRLKGFGGRGIGGGLDNPSFGGDGPSLGRIRFDWIKDETRLEWQWV